VIEGDKDSCGEETLSELQAMTVKQNAVKIRFIKIRCFFIKYKKAIGYVKVYIFFFPDKKCSGLNRCAKNEKP
jgi:hypothetical protein